MALTFEKKKLLSDIFDNMKRDALAKVNNMPEDWDGHELRSYVAEKAAWEVTHPMRDKRSARAKAFRNEMITRNL